MRFAAIFLIILSGCTAPYPVRYSQNDAGYKQCEYEAKLATPDTSNIFMDLKREADLINMCMERRK